MKISKKTIIAIAVLAVLNIAALIYTNANAPKSGGGLTSVDLSTCNLEELGGDNIALTIPADYVYGAAQSDLDKVAAEAGYEAVILNEDGTVTYKITKAQHKEMLADLSTGIESGLAALPGSDGYKDVRKVTSENEFTTYNIYTTNSQPDFDTSMSVMVLKMYSTMYYAFKSETDVEIHFNFYNKYDELISTLDTKLM